MQAVESSAPAMTMKQLGARAAGCALLPPCANIGAWQQDRPAVTARPCPTPTRAAAPAAGNRLHSFCDASLRAPNPTMMVVPGERK